jgi:uncharacterized protein YjbJ (UPF0337 family)
MGLWDRLMGRGKKAEGDVTGDASLRREGMHQEAEAAAEERGQTAEQVAQGERDTAAEQELKKKADS